MAASWQNLRETGPPVHSESWPSAVRLPAPGEVPPWVTLLDQPPFSVAPLCLLPDGLGPPPANNELASDKALRDTLARLASAFPNELRRCLHRFYFLGGGYANTLRAAWDSPTFHRLLIEEPQLAYFWVNLGGGTGGFVENSLDGHRHHLREHLVDLL